MKAINAIRMGGVEVLPLVEGGKGVAVSNGATCGGWASGGGVGTFSAVNADSYDADGNLIRQVYHGKTRRERPEVRMLKPDYLKEEPRAPARIAIRDIRNNG